MARLECDLVMKGGITSGVIYPRLVAELSKTYTFRCIGGTSAGAIAAAATAAAQLGVHTGANPAAFEALAKLPSQLGKRPPGSARSMLFNLFQPQPPLQGCFEVLVACIGAGTVKKTLLRSTFAAVRRFPQGALLGAIPGVLLLLQSWGLGSLLSIALIAIGAVLGALAQAVRAFGRSLPTNHFGLCNGMGEETALTPWLDGYLNRLAGKRSDEPLTFGELWAGSLRETATEAPSVPEDSRVIELAMMTTALNLGRPFRLPFEPREVYFVKEELAPFFPERVIRWLTERSRPSATAQALSQPGKTFYALPEAADFPVVMAVRLSLSFPLLLSALPLHTIDRSLKVNADAPREATRIYFSDGGICSNFPIHFFDHPLPSRPTFGVNLRGFHPEHPGERVWLPEPLRSNRGLKNHYPALSDAPGLGSVIGFLATIVTTMQDWRDRLQLAMPGFRDRIVHISHSPDEGGLNLDMPAATIETLAGSGAQAADVLVEAFAKRASPQAANAWDNHLRIRVRGFVALMQGYLERISQSLQRPREPSFDDVLLDGTPPSYPFSDADAPAQAVNLLHALDALSREMAEVDLRAGAPRPSPDLRVVPRV